MPNKRLVCSIFGLGLSLFWTVAVGDEILGHISDDTEPKSALPSTAEDNTNSDRKIIYRVICSPADEQLPDCEKPFHDVESYNQPKVAEETVEQPQDTDSAESATDDKPQKPVEAVKPATKSTQKSAAATKKQPVSKKSKSVAKSSAHKTVAKKGVTKPVNKKAPAKKK